MSEFNNVIVIVILTGIVLVFVVITRIVVRTWMLFYPIATGMVIMSIIFIVTWLVNQLGLLL